MANDFKAWAVGTAPNVLSQVEYEALIAALSNKGFRAGIADSKAFNKVFRQATLGTAALAEIIEEFDGLDVTDSGSLAAFVTRLKAALVTSASLALPTGAGGVGANDYLSGVLFDSMQEFIRGFRGSVRAAWFGVVGDYNAQTETGADDTAALQAAIDFCAQFPQWPPLVLPGACLISESLMIDRLVDAQKSEFVICGDGPGCGVATKTAIPLFDSTLTVTADPRSEGVTFRGLTLQCNSAATVAYVLTKKFLRVKSIDCYFEKIKYINADTYIQTHRFVVCTARYWTGDFIGATTGFDVRSSGGVYEFGGGFAVFPSGSYGCTFDDLYEGSTGPYVKSGTSFGLAVSGYFEGNDTPEVYFSYDGGTANGCSLGKSSFLNKASNKANPSYYPVIWGIASGCSSSGVYSDHNLHDDIDVPFGGLTSNDMAVAILNRSRQIITPQLNGSAGYAGGYTAYVGGGQAGAVLMEAEVNQVAVSTVTGIDSVRLPATTTDPYKARRVTVVNDSAYAIQVFGTGSDSIAFSPSGTGVSQASATARTYIQSAAGRWSYV